MTKKAILRITIFYIIGITISNIFRFNLFDLNFSNTSVLGFLLASPLGAIGLLVGALISLYLLKKERKLSFSLLGTSPILSLLMMLIPFVLLGIFGVENSNNMNSHYYGVIGGIAAFIYCFSEEIGWRGYLQDELKDIKEWKRVLIIGFLWYLWHLTFLTNQDLIQNLQFLGWMIFGSWGIGKVIDSTKSMIAATCFHMIINIMMFNGNMRGLSGSTKMIIIAISVTLWILILIIWRRQEKTVTNNAQ